jgi:hypothetical protein
MSLISNLNCSICLESYSCTKESKKPKALPCGHTICNGCVQKLDKCPTCRVSFHMASYFSRSTCPTNFEVLNALESKENPKIDKVCLVCKEKAVLICEDCRGIENTSFCESCFEKEHGSIITKNHKKLYTSNYCVECNKEVFKCKGHAIVKHDEIKSYIEKKCPVLTKERKEHIEGVIRFYEYVETDKQDMIEGVLEKVREKLQNEFNKIMDRGELFHKFYDNYNKDCSEITENHTIDNLISINKSFKLLDTEELYENFFSYEFKLSPLKKTKRSK